MQTVKQIQVESVAIQRRDAAKRLVGALAQSIRADWGEDIAERYNLMRELVNDYGDEDRAECLEWLDDDENRKACKSDGRTMRDWPGPYGDMVSFEDLELLGQAPECLGRYWRGYVYGAEDS